MFPPGMFCSQFLMWTQDNMSLIMIAFDNNQLATLSVLTLSLLSQYLQLCWFLNSLAQKAFPHWDLTQLEAPERETHLILQHYGILLAHTPPSCTLFLHRKGTWAHNSFHVDT